jgi:hypothetical protein
MGIDRATRALARLGALSEGYDDQGSLPFRVRTGMPESGMADIAATMSAAQAQTAYGQALQAQGWDVNLSTFDATTPDLPPRPLHQCRVEARKGTRVLRLALEQTGASSQGSLYWADGPVNALLGGSPGPC